MGAFIYSEPLKNLTCENCKGTCYNANASVRQQNVKDNFGYPIPSECASSTYGEDRCPYSQVLSNKPSVTAATAVAKINIV